MIGLDAAAMCLALVIYHEARSEPPLTQLGVAQVAINRWNDEPGTLCDIVMRPSQFHVPHQPHEDDPAWIAAQTLAGDVLRFQPPDVTGGAQFFSHNGRPPVRGLKRTVRLGAMTFWSKRR